MLPFDRLVRAVDKWSREAGYPDVIMQIGNGHYVPERLAWNRIMSPAEFKAAVDSCDLIVTHLGVGSIIAALQAEKPVVAMPRKRALGEATSDHQMEGVEWIRQRHGVWIADDEEKLSRFLEDFLGGRLVAPKRGPLPQVASELIENVRNFILK